MAERGLPTSTRSGVPASGRDSLAAVLGPVVLVASVVSVEAGVTVVLVELTLGVAVGNVFDMHSQGWLDFIASFASIVLTVLAADGG